MIRISMLALWIVLGGGVLFLLVAAINIKNHKACKGVAIEIRGVETDFFLNRKDIMELLFTGKGSRPEGKPIASFDLQRMESSLEKNVWVKKADLFFDNNLVLHIDILEKEPVARIFTPAGYSFYIDSSGDRMPLNEKMRARLPVFTGFPGSKLRVSKEDSILLYHIKRISQYIVNDPFWMAQIAQIDITLDRNFEMIPTIGNHIIDFGNSDDQESKFRRLMLFYKQVLGPSGFDRYSRVDLRYAGQVVGTRKGVTARVDSVQAMKNIERMIAEARKVASDSVYTP